MPEQPVRHLEPFLDAIKAALVANLDTAITAVNAAHDDFDIDLIPATSIFVGGFSTAVYPMVEIATPDWTMTRLSLGQFSGSLQFPAAIKVSCLAFDSETLYRTILRYMSAVIAVVLDPDSIPGADVDRDRGIRGSYYFNPETSEIQDLEGAGVVVFYLEADETRA